MPNIFRAKENPQFDSRSENYRQMGLGISYLLILQPCLSHASGAIKDSSRLSETKSGDETGTRLIRKHSPDIDGSCHRSNPSRNHWSSTREHLAQRRHRSSTLLRTHTCRRQTKTVESPRSPIQTFRQDQEELEQTSSRSSRIEDSCSSTSSRMMRCHTAYPESSNHLRLLT